MHSQAGWAADTGPFRRGWDMFAIEPGSDEAYAGSVTWCGDSLFLHQEKCVLEKCKLRPEKVGILVLLKEGAEVTYRMHGQEWRFGIAATEGSRPLVDKTLVVDSYESKDGGGGGGDSLHVRVLLRGLKATELLDVVMDHLEREFIVFDRENFTEEIPVDLGGSSTLFVSEKRAGRVYVNGVFVTTSPVFARLKLAINIPKHVDHNLVDTEGMERTVLRAALEGPPKTRVRMLRSILRCCVAEGLKPEAEAHVTNVLRSISGIVAVVEKALEEKHQKMVYLSSSGLSRAQRSIVKKLDYMLVPTGWLVSSIPFTEFLTMHIETKKLSRDEILGLPKKSQNHLRRIQAVFDTFASIVGQNAIQVAAWAPPRKLEKWYQSIHFDKDKAYVPKLILTWTRTDLLFGVVIGAVEEAYGARCLLNVVKHFDRTRALKVPSQTTLQGFIAEEKKTRDSDDSGCEYGGDCDSDCDCDCCGDMSRLGEKRKLRDDDDDPRQSFTASNIL